MLGRYIARRLRQSPHPHPPRPWTLEKGTDPTPFIEENFARHTLFVLDVGRRTIKFAFIGLAGLGGTAAAVYEGLHQYVENKELAPETDEEVKRWEWDVEAEKWSGDPRHGGTDPKLGFKGRHAVRSAWMALNWGVGYSTAVVGTDTAGTQGLPGPGGLRVIDARLQRAEDFLQSAIRIAEKRSVSPHTITQLVLRHAMVAERLGLDFMPQARSNYERAWNDFSGHGIEAARIAANLGNIHSRAGSSGDALAWWSKAIAIVHPTKPDSPEFWNTLPSSLEPAPSSPSGQRLLSAVLVSLSAFYAQSGQLKQAQAIEEKALNMLRSIPPPPSVATASPPQALHALFLLQRSSLLSVHLAEVLHAQKSTPTTSIQWLTSAAESSERVACALTGLPAPSFLRPKESTTPTSTLAVASSAQVPHPRFTTSHTTSKVAHNLLRDARRTSAEAWNLLGILYETEGKKMDVALSCYERAIDWAGTPGDSNTTKQAAEGTLGSDWDVYWGNYMRVRRVLEDPK